MLRRYGRPGADRPSLLLNNLVSGCASHQACTGLRRRRLRYVEHSWLDLHESGTYVRMSVCPYVRMSGYPVARGSHNRLSRHNLDQLSANCRHTVPARAMFNLETAGTSIQTVVPEN